VVNKTRDVICKDKLYKLYKEAERFRDPMLEGAIKTTDVICKNKMKDLTKLYMVAERFRDSTLEGTKTRDVICKDKEKVPISSTRPRGSVTTCSRGPTWPGMSSARTKRRT